MHPVQLCKEVHSFKSDSMSNIAQENVLNMFYVRVSIGDQQMIAAFQSSFLVVKKSSRVYASIT